MEILSCLSVLQAIPKIELHVHLEGSVPPETLLHLANKNGVELPVDSVEGIADWYRFKDFPHFARIYGIIARCIRSAADIETLLREFLRRQATQNIIHTEITFTALTHLRNYGINLDDQLKALEQARIWAERQLDVSCGIIIDIPRENASEADSCLIAEWVAANHGDTLIALGLGGYEVGYPPGAFSKSFAIASNAGVPAVVHAGETEGPKSIWGAIEDLNAVRIGHGIRAIEDAELVRHLVRRRIPLEVCLSSNVCLGVSDSYHSHPLRALVDSGVTVTINTDDPPMFGTTLSREFELALTELEMDFGFVERSLEAACEFSLLTDQKKQKLRERLRAGLTPLRRMYR